MKVIKTSKKGIRYLHGKLHEKATTVTKVIFWKIPHKTKEEIKLKIGRYKKDEFSLESVESKNPRSEMTLEEIEFLNLIEFLQENYEPFKLDVKRYIPIDESFNPENIEHLRAIFDNKDKEELLSFIVKNNILPEDLISSLQYQSQKNAIDEFESMLAQNLYEKDWQDWFKKNDWVLGSEFVKILDEREIDSENIADYLMQAYDGFLDIIEIKRPAEELKFWTDKKDHKNYIPSTELTKAITQATTYIFELERETNSLKFLEKVGHVKTIKPRCVLIFGRSIDWNDEQCEAYRILNSCYHNLSIMTYDHVLKRAKRILNINEKDASEEDTDEFVTF